LERFKVIAFTHKQLDIADIGKLHLADNMYAQQLHQLKQHFQLDELMYLSTCNRVEFFIVHKNNTPHISPSELLMVFAPQINSTLLTHLSYNAIQYENEVAVKHIFKVAASIDSLVVGEREIITQVRESYERCVANNLCGDMLRIIIKQTINCAKQVYTETNIARNPVSVVSLAFNQLKEVGVQPTARVLVVGAGITNTNMVRFMKKFGVKDFHIFNRTLANAQKLANEVKGNAYTLDALPAFDKGFDVLITCTGATETIITRDLYATLLNNNTHQKTVVDLAVPNDFDTDILNQHKVHLIEVKSLQELAQQNIAKREKELGHCKKIIVENMREFELLYKTRKVEVAMREVPRKVKEIRDNAVNTVFAKDLEQLDEQSREVLSKIIDFMEKKYISVPMIMAKDILLEEIN
jgi:glutamyl-tRNA reductase